MEAAYRVLTIRSCLGLNFAGPSDGVRAKGDDSIGGGLHGLRIIGIVGREKVHNILSQHGNSKQDPFWDGGSSLSLKIQANSNQCFSSDSMRLARLLATEVSHCLTADRFVGTKL